MITHEGNKVLGFVGPVEHEAIAAVVHICCRTAVEAIERLEAQSAFGRCERKDMINEALGQLSAEPKTYKWS